LAILHLASLGGILFKRPLNQAKAITSLLIRYPTPAQIAGLSDEEMRGALTADFSRLGRLRPHFIPEIRALAQNSIGIAA
jgi:hypothetical protein